MLLKILINTLTIDLLNNWQQTQDRNERNETQQLSEIKQTVSMSM